MKRKIAFMLAVLMSVASFVGCGQEAASDEKSTESAINSETPASNKESAGEVRENYQIQLLCFSKPDFQSQFNDYVKDSPLYDELVEKTGVELEVFGLDDDQVSVRMTSGDLGDLIQVQKEDQLSTLIENEQILPLNDLLDKYAPEIKEEYGSKWWEAATEMFGADGQLYMLPIYNGSSGVKDLVEGRTIYLVRWDLYKELGYPEIKTPEDLIEVKKDMITLQPTTADGKPVYGESFYLDDIRMDGLTRRFTTTYGLVDAKGGYISQDVRTNEIMYDFINMNSPYWQAVEYFYKANQAGILDPDSFTQQAADYEAKINSGEHMGPIYYPTLDIQKDTDEPIGYGYIPVEGTGYHTNMNTTLGGGIYYGLCIPATCEDPEQVMELIKFIFSDEGSRMCYSGVEGIHWEYVDGVPQFTDLYYELEKNGVVAQELSNVPPIRFFAGKAAGEILADGYPADLKMSEAYFAKKEYSPVLKDYCEYYGVSYPTQVFEQWKEQGKMFDLSGYDDTLKLTVNNEDILRIDAICFQIALEAVPKLVLAANDTEYEAVKADTLAALEAAGAKEAEAFYLEYWDSLK